MDVDGRLTSIALLIVDRLVEDSQLGGGCNDVTPTLATRSIRMLVKDRCVMDVEGLPSATAPLIVDLLPDDLLLGVSASTCQ